MSDQEILDVVAAATDLKYACKNLVCGAKKARCDDNVTCLLIRFVEERWYQTWLRKLRHLGAMIMSKLYLKFDKRDTRDHISAGVVTIGRQPDNLLQIDNPAVSGHHAKVYWDGDH